MQWNPIRNKDYCNHDTCYQGECTRFAETATLSIRLRGTQVSRNDLQPSFSPHLIECNLLKEKDEKDTTCMLWCPCFEAYKNSHDY